MLAFGAGDLGSNPSRAKDSKLRMNELRLAIGGRFKLFKSSNNSLLCMLKTDATPNRKPMSEGSRVTLKGTPVIALIAFLVVSSGFAYYYVDSAAKLSAKNQQISSLSALVGSQNASAASLQAN